MKPIADVVGRAQELLNRLDLPAESNDRPASPSLPYGGVPERFHGISWANLAALVNPDGEPSLAGVVSRAGVLRGDSAASEIRQRSRRSQRVVFVGETHLGKTISACAALREAGAAIAGDRLRARFVSESDLLRPGLIAWAASADVLVLDNLGWALAGAPAEGGLAAQRRAPACELVDMISKRPLGKCRLIVTTWMSETEIGRAYSGGVQARIFEGADVVQFVHEAPR